MPKVIPNLGEALLQAAARILAQEGYSGLTMRAVAAECHVGLGTLYNYYASKEALAAAYLLQSWQQRYGAALDPAPTEARAMLAAQYRAIRDFLDAHAVVFRDPQAVQTFHSASGRYHGQLVAQLAAPLRQFCPAEGTDPAFRAEFAAQALLTWTVADRSFDELAPLLLQIVRPGETL